MESLRPLLTTYAYNILGSLEDAQDIVQDVYLKFLNVDQRTIENTKSYLIRMVINHSINQRKSQAKRFITYRGDGLPQAVATEKADSALIRKDIISQTITILLEKLNAKQRAVFILREAYECDHAEISEVLGITEEQSRQLLSRGKKNLGLDVRVKGKRGHFEYAKEYFGAVFNGDVEKLQELLSDEIRLTTDFRRTETAGRRRLGKKSDIYYVEGASKI